MKKSMLFIVALLMSAVVFGQAPKMFNYQGIARNSSGTPLANKDISVKISILDGSTAKYVETHSVTTNDFGLYKLKIGDGTVVSGSMDSIIWYNGTKNIQVAIDPDGGTNYTSLGTTQLLSVPYALSTGHAPGPIAYGTVSSSGNITNGSGNFTVSYNTGLKRWEISITGVNYYYTKFSTLVTPITLTASGVSTNSVSGKLLIKTYNSSGTADQYGFAFIVYP